MSILVSYLIVAGITVILLGIYTFRSFSRKGRIGIFLGATLASSIGMATSYVLSFLFSSNHLLSSVFSSLQFIGMDLLLIMLMQFALEYTQINVKAKHNYFLISLFHTLLSIDIIVCLLNPFLSEFSVGIIQCTELIPGYFSIKYDMHGFYYYHLALDYTLVVVAAEILISKALRVPREYKMKYLNIVIGILVIVDINATYLFLPHGSWNTLDYSILTYGLVGIFVFWCTFKYAQKDLINRFKSSIFDSIGQGLILFDYNDDLMLINSIAEKYFPLVNFKNKITLNEFASLSGLTNKMLRDDDFYSFQFLVTGDSRKTSPIRCDYRKIYNDKKQLVAKLLVFADMSAEVDLLTGFQTWETFKRFAKDNNDAFTYPACIGICDIIGLGIYNEVRGREAGDNLLRELSSLMQIEFNNDCNFVRGREAALIVITYGLTIEEMNEKFDAIDEKFSQQLTYSCLVAKDESRPIVQDIMLTFSGINAKRLVDKRSTHSSVIGSLVKALQECDTDTEAHVKRTQIVGTALGRRIGLSDLDLSNLSLLCLLHDIGKIGVPLEILNKPGKLTPEEWEAIQSHVIKGYNIAMSSEELRGIAQMIKHHHERWDGKGYPDGLSRESIPVLSRIIAVVDAFDAMVNDRCYRKALPTSVAKSEILKNAGSQFDPYIASEFLKLIEEGSFYRLREDVAEEVKKDQKEAAIKSEAVRVNTSEAAVYPVVYSKYLLDSDNYIIQIDEAFTEITGYTMDDVQNGNMKQRDLIPEEERTAYAALAQAQIGRNQMAYFEHRILCKDGRTKFVLCIGTLKYDSVVRDMKTEIIICDALQTNTARSLNKFLEAKNNKRLEQWEEMYRKDSLTGLLTHKSFQNDIEDLLLKKSKITFCMMDIDYFKQYNDSFGHHAGDEFLIAFAQGILACAGEDCLCCRMGGDEFAVAAVGDIDIRGFANKLSQQLDFICSSNKHSVTCSIGICVSSEELNSFNKLYECADKMLYECKNSGRNRYKIYNEE